MAVEGGLGQGDALCLHACSSEARRGGGEGGGLVEKIVHVPTWTHM
jgi:hypothetical protein